VEIQNLFKLNDTSTQCSMYTLFYLHCSIYIVLFTFFYLHADFNKRIRSVMTNPLVCLEACHHLHLSRPIYN